MNAVRLAERLKQKATETGFQSCRITSATLPRETGERLNTFLSLDRHGDMTWMEDTAERRASPQAMWPAARSAIVVALSYAPEQGPLQRLGDPGLGNISVYAQGRDYHEVVKGKLKVLGQWLAREARADVKVFVDTAPLMEKPLAQQSGTGWQGKHTNLLSRSLGSWFFLGSILTEAALPFDEAESDHCGSCRACLDVCPTRAFPHPYQLDARRCISYLTIEHKGHIAREFRKPMGNRIFGCDDCLAVCPWNKFAAAGREAKLLARPDIANLRLSDLLRLDEAAFRSLFSGSPVKRSGRDRFLRNVLIAAGNSGNQALVPHVEALLGDGSALVRAMAVWALNELASERALALKPQFEPSEDDEAVRKEWREILQ